MRTGPLIPPGGQPPLGRAGGRRLALDPGFEPSGSDRDRGSFGGLPGDRGTRLSRRAAPRLGRRAGAAANQRVRSGVGVANRAVRCRAAPGRLRGNALRPHPGRGRRVAVRLGDARRVVRRSQMTVVCRSPDVWTVWEWVTTPYDSASVAEESEGTRCDRAPEEVAAWPCSPDGSGAATATPREREP